MNEMKMVREFLQEPAPPSTEATGEALQALESEISGHGTRRTRTRRPLIGRFQLGLTGLVAVGAATAVAIAMLGGGGTGTPQPQQSDMSARSILLAAAEKAAKEPSGRYWRLQTVSAQAYRVGKGAGAYTILGTREQWDRWTARSLSDPDVLYARDLGARPLTKVDEAAWKKAGSPESMRVRSGGRWLTFSTVPGRTAERAPGEAAPAQWAVSSRTSPAEKRKLRKRVEESCSDLPEKGSVEAERRRLSCGLLKWTRTPDPELASDPERYKELLFPTGKRDDDPAATLMAGFAFLTHLPASPEVRAEVFRTLAGTSGIRTIGTVTDERGRTGIALSARRTAPVKGAASMDFQLILEPKTYKILAGRSIVVQAGDEAAGMRPGDVYNRTLVLDAGWTDEQSHHP
ncbi:hypothetical protein [Actinomadura sp. 9N407]|uniref:hypothetical protein n=1 Tax=Actinomadura sp. 9N407 TaxID=3375154 RepID=UPI0037B886B4